MRSYQQDRQQLQQMIRLQQQSLQNLRRRLKYYQQCHPQAYQQLRGLVIMAALMSIAGLAISLYIQLGSRQVDTGLIHLGVLVIFILLIVIGIKR